MARRPAPAAFPRVVEEPDAAEVAAVRSMVGRAALLVAAAAAAPPPTTATPRHAATTSAVWRFRKFFMPPRIRPTREGPTTHL